MNFGVCKSLDMAKTIKNAGYDYIEANLKAISEMSDEEFEKCEQYIKDADIPCESSNCFFPNEYVLTGDAVDYEKIADYADKVLCRAKRLGIKVSVLGSGKTRTIPEGYDRQKAVEQFKKVVSICADAGRKYGIKIALEPLNESETNLLNTVGEAYEFCKELGDCDVGIAADFYHMFRMNEDPYVLVTAKDYVFHLHIARPNVDRKAPSKEDIDTLKIWADAIKKSGYNKRLSLECTSKADFNESIKNMAEVKCIFE